MRLTAKPKRKEVSMVLNSVIRSVFGHDDYIGAEHIAHEPSWWQRRKSRRDAVQWVLKQIPNEIEIRICLT